MAAPSRGGGRDEQQRPHGREQVAEVLADRATGVAVKGLKGDAGGVASCGARLRVDVGLGEVGDEERPADAGGQRAGGPMRKIG